MPEGGIFGGVFSRGGPVADDAAWLRAMLAAESALARALEQAGLAAPGAGSAVTAAAARPGDFDIAELSRSSALTGNPVPGLARALTRLVPDPAAKSAVHKGATSQDIMDTAAMLLARDAIDAAADSLSGAAAAVARLADAHRGSLMIGRTLLQQAVPVTFGVVAAGWLAGLAGEHRATIMIGRTLLQQAVPVTFGLVAAGWLTSMDEARSGLAAVRSQRLAVQFGGAAGTLASLGDDGPRVVALLAEELGLAQPVLPWHTDRLRIIDVATSLVRVTAALGKIARDVTLLAQSEIGEVSEGSGNGAPRDASSPRRGGSSAMPHKRNPVAAIAILGCTKQAPGLLTTLVACAEQELQRAAGAWHAEWEPLTALLRLTGSAASWAAELMSGLVVDASRMAANLAATKDLPLAEHVTSLLAGVLGGVQAHDLVAEAGQRAVSAGLPLRDVLLAVPKLEGRLASAGITPEQIESALEPAGYLGAADAFVTAALAAHEALDAQLSKVG